MSMNSVLVCTRRKKQQRSNTQEGNRQPHKPSAPPYTSRIWYQVQKKRARRFFHFLFVTCLIAHGHHLILQNCGTESNHLLQKILRNLCAAHNRHSWANLQLGLDRWVEVGDYQTVPDRISGQVNRRAKRERGYGVWDMGSFNCGGPFTCCAVNSKQSRRCLLRFVFIGRFRYFGSASILVRFTRHEVRGVVFLPVAAA